jgi:hypothetical protein
VHHLSFYHNLSLIGSVVLILLPWLVYLHPVFLIDEHLEKLVRDGFRDWIGLDWIGLDWNGMEWNGMEWNGIEWVVFSSQDTDTFYYFVNYIIDYLMPHITIGIMYSLE